MDEQMQKKSNETYPPRRKCASGAKNATTTMRKIQEVKACIRAP